VCKIHAMSGYECPPLTVSLDLTLLVLLKSDYVTSYETFCCFLLGNVSHDPSSRERHD
jgi:hypothetical protein